MHEGTPYFNQIVEESPYLAVDGELPWGTWSMNEDPDNPEARMGYRRQSDSQTAFPATLHLAQCHP